jgi:peptide/nickel transport system permease protein
MSRHFLIKLGQSLILLFCVLLLAFFMLRLTGDPVTLMMSREASAEQIEAFREEMGFNRPLIVQLFDFIGGALTGDFGESLHYRTPALPLVLGRLPATIELAVVALLMAVLVGVPFGLLSGSKPGSWMDSVGRFLALMGQSIPNFWLGMILILIFAQTLGWFPVFGRDEPKSVVLPAFVLSLASMGQIIRLTRSTVLEVRGEDYIRTAHSKGLKPGKIYVKHVLKIVAPVVISVAVVQFGYMLGGSIYIETIYAWPGIGQLLQQALGWRDFPLVQTITVFTSAVVLLLDLFTDVAYVWLDPRIRYGK